MASYYKLDLKERKNLGTSAARSIRRNGGVLVNYYYTGEENKNFSNVFLKQLKTKNIHSTLNNKNKVSYLNKENSNIKKDDLSEGSKEIFEKIRDDISSLRKEMNGMIVK